MLEAEATGHRTRRFLRVIRRARGRGGGGLGAELEQVRFFERQPGALGDADDLLIEEGRERLDVRSVLHRGGLAELPADLAMAAGQPVRREDGCGLGRHDAHGR
jgi:hypothetical protein